MTAAQQKPAGLDLSLPVGPQLVRLLRQAIIVNMLPPGARISESEIALSHGVSRQPVREAFIRLAEEGLLEIRPQRGTFVRKINLGAVLDARFVREAIEADVVKLCANAPPPGLVGELRDQLSAQRRLGGGDPAGFIMLDDRFHRSLAEAAGRPNAWAVIDGTKSHLDRVRQLTQSQLAVDHLIAQHEAIVDAIAARDVVGAEAAMRRHLKMILSDLPAIRAACPQFFDPEAEGG